MLVIVAGGRLEKAVLSQIRRADFIIGVDSGAAWLLRHHIIPDLAIGDFDSVTNQELHAIEKSAGRVEKFPRMKNKTDLELAIDAAISLRPTEVTVYGAIGTRFDQTISAIGLLQKLESHNIYGEIVDNFNKIFVVRRQKDLKSSMHRYVSIIPLSKRATITLSGFVYNVDKLTLSHLSTHGVSNEIKESKATVVVHSGLVLVIYASDKNPFVGKKNKKYTS